MLYIGFRKHISYNMPLNRLFLENASTKSPFKHLKLTSKSTFRFCSSVLWQMKSLHLTGIPQNKYNKWRFETIFDFLATAGSGNRSIFLPFVFIVVRWMWSIGVYAFSISYGCQSKNKQNQTSQPENPTHSKTPHHPSGKIREKIENPHHSHTIKSKLLHCTCKLPLPIPMMLPVVAIVGFAGRYAKAKNFSRSA